MRNLQLLYRQCYCRFTQHFGKFTHCSAVPVKHLKTFTIVFTALARVRATAPREEI